MKRRLPLGIPVGYFERKGHVPNSRQQGLLGLTSSDEYRVRGMSLGLLGCVIDVQLSLFNMDEMQSHALHEAHCWLHRLSI